MNIRTTKIQKHPYGYAISIWRDDVRLATAYGGSPEDTEARAAVVVTAFQRPGFGTAAPMPKLPADVRAYAQTELGWSKTTIDKVEAAFYLTHEMNWSEASWEEIRDALAEVLNEVLEG